MKKLLTTTFTIISFVSPLVAGLPGICVGCHGKNGSHNSMVKTSKPSTMSKTDIITALEGYKDGTRNKYGDGMIMRNFAKNLTSTQIKDIANIWGK